MSQTCFLLCSSLPCGAGLEVHQLLKERDVTVGRALLEEPYLLVEFSAHVAALTDQEVHERTSATVGRGSRKNFGDGNVVVLLDHSVGVGDDEPV